MAHRSSLLDSVGDLVQARRAQGLRVIMAPLDGIYAEFSNGRVSSQAIKDFLTYAYQSWQAPAPRYVLFIGDGTYDPENELNYGARPDASPMHLELGTYDDFATDNWFVASPDGSGVPLMSVGRIPAADPATVLAFVQKLLNYEAGISSPANPRALTFVADADHLNEGFAANSASFAATARTTNHLMSTQVVDRAQLASDADAKTAILNTFQNSPILMTYVGHGAAETAQPLHDVRLGDLMLKAKVSMGASAQTTDTLRSWTLIGDPSMPLPAAPVRARPRRLASCSS